MPTILTVGHSTKPMTDFVSLLQGAGVETVIDIRSRPQSRFNPQYNKKSLAAELPAAGIAYEWRGNNLGGLDGNVDYEASIVELAARAAAGEHLVVMCSEGPHTKCHRSYMLTPSLQAEGVDIKHLQWTGQLTDATPAKPTKVGDTPIDDALF